MMTLVKAWTLTTIGLLVSFASVAHTHAQSSDAAAFDPFNTSRAATAGSGASADSQPVVKMAESAPAVASRPPVAYSRSTIGGGSGAPAGHLSAMTPMGPSMPPSGYMAPPMGGAMGHGPYGVMPAAYQGAMPTEEYYSGPMMGSGMGGGMGGGMGEMYGEPGLMEGMVGGCPHCGNQGCEYCDGHSGILMRLLGLLAPYDEGGCCAQRSYDIQLDVMSLSRADVSGYVPFTSQGLILPPGQPNVVLSTNDLVFGEETTIKFTGALQIGPGTVMELSYMGLGEWQSSATVEDQNQELYSVLSQFGTNPFNGFQDTDRSFEQSINYSSEFDNVEMNFRHRWVGPNCRVQGSWLAGIRYMWLKESFLYSTRGDDDMLLPIDRFSDFQVNTGNSLTGFQLGTDLWACIVPGLSVGGEVKAGVYGNYAKQNTRITAHSINLDLSESALGGDVAFLGDANIGFIYRMTYSWTLRAGYYMMYVDGVALAPENFNTVPPEQFFPAPPLGHVRNVTIDADGSIFYHGAMISAEWMW